MKLTPPVVISTVAAPACKVENFKRTLAAEVSYVVRRSIINYDAQLRLMHLLTRNT